MTDIHSFFYFFIPDLSLSGRKSTPHDCFHIAFGSKIPIATPGSAGKRMSARKDGSGTSRSLHSSHREAAGKIPLIPALHSLKIRRAVIDLHSFFNSIIDI